MDADGDGALDASALDDSPYCQVAWSDDLESSDACGEKLIKEIDNNGDGKVHFTLTPTLTLALTLALALTPTPDPHPDPQPHPHPKPHPHPNPHPNPNPNQVDFNEYMSWWSKLPPTKADGSEDGGKRYDVHLG